ncbi:Short chain dehydrogenase [Phytophthora cinnamomi]|uniref:Short chain dehydrogenase n=1 Tax=Phytophthora cinnamomi TaxID=4785 RepID=UPI00355A5D93|nr:Short chain dehydrogenase [Phytophthora cinnamomi]
MAAKTVLITGSNRGIGLAFATHYKKEGWQVIGCARNVDAAADLKKLQPWKLLTLDTSSDESIAAAAKSLENVPINLLINNAGIMDVHDLQSTTKADLLRHFEVNAVGPFLVTRALLPNLRLAVAAEGQAVVAQVTSRMGSITDNGSGGYYGYRASKTALNMLTKSLAVDLEKEKIGCLLLHPGYVNTAMVGFTGSVSPEDSVKGLTKIIARAKLEDSAKMFHFEKGEVLPW